MLRALALEHGRVCVPAHHGFEEAEEEAAVAARLVLRETRNRVGYVREDLSPVELNRCYN
jgi:hypothetical protein